MRESHGELEARIGLLTRELNEAFERETATDELLRVIASSPTDIKPVLDAVAASAAREAKNDRFSLAIPGRWLCRAER